MSILLLPQEEEKYSKLKMEKTEWTLAGIDAEQPETNSELTLENEKTPGINVSSNGRTRKAERLHTAKLDLRAIYTTLIPEQQYNPTER